MKIVYGLKSKDIMRMDAIVISALELPTTAGIIAFRGDDRRPSQIFAEGFKPRNPACQLEGIQVVDQPRTWDDIINETARKRKDFFTMQKCPRSATCIVGQDEICFRPNHLDLRKETCVSLTLDPELGVGFPLDESNDGSQGITYLYAVNLKGPYLPTYEVQEAGGNLALSQSMEVTSLEVEPGDVLGAAVIHRQVRGMNAMSEVTYRLTLWEDNPILGNQPRGTYINETIHKRTGRNVVLAGTKMVSAGMKKSTNTASNKVLVNAIQALSKHTPISIQGQVPGLQEDTMSKSLQAFLD